MSTTVSTLASILVLLAGAAHSAADLRVIARTQDPAGGTGASFGDTFSAPFIDPAGDSAFLGKLTGAGVNTTNDDAYWLAPPDAAPSLILREGDPAPGLAGVTLSFNTVFGAAFVFTGDRRVSFTTLLTGPGVDATNDVAIYSGTTGNLQILVREGDQAPGLPAGTTFLNSNDVRMNSSGVSTFQTTIAGPGVDASNFRAFYSGTPGNLGLLARQGDQAPGLPAGVIHSQVIGARSINNNDLVLFVTDLAGPGVDSNNKRCLWLGTPGSLDLLARAGDPAPDLAGNRRFWVNFADLGINDAGQIAFSNTIVGPGITSLNNVGIWAGNPGSLSLVARTGTTAPGTDALFDTLPLLGRPLINAQGIVVFRALLRGPTVVTANNNGVWSGSPEAVTLLARRGSQAPGLPAGVVFEDFSAPVINASGTIAFNATLTGAGVNGTNNQTLWVREPDGTLSLILRAGDPFDVDPDPDITDLRTVQSTVIATGTGGQDGYSGGINDDDDYTLNLRFTDGTGAVVTTVPSSSSPGCSPADFAPPYGVLNFFDVSAFLSAYNTQDDAADLANPIGVWNFFDVSAFLSLYNAGCP